MEGAPSEDGRSSLMLIRMHLLVLVDLFAFLAFFVFFDDIFDELLPDTLPFRESSCLLNIFIFVFLDSMSEVRV